MNVSERGKGVHLNITFVNVTKPKPKETETKKKPNLISACLCVGSEGDTCLFINLLL